MLCIYECDKCYCLIPIPDFPHSCPVKVTPYDEMCHRIMLLFVEILKLSKEMDISVIY